MKRFKNLEEFIHDSWHLLVKAAIKRSGDYQTPVIGTLGDGQAAMRIVVLREVRLQQRQLVFYTDRRSEKMQELEQNARLNWLFWDARKKVQLRMSGECTWHIADGDSRKYWERLPVQGRKSYAAEQPPGTKVETPTEGLPEDWSEDMPLEQTEYAFDNFTVVVCTVDQVQLLHLHGEGHQRAAFEWDGSGWKGSWLIP